MMVRTTKQIDEEYFDIDIHFPKSDKFKEYQNEEWVCLVDLKKRIEQLTSACGDDPWEQWDNGYKQAMKDVLSLLHSSEQTAWDTKNGSPLSQESSVSGEHNTGEGADSVESVASSPVQNPKCKTCGVEREYFVYKDTCIECAHKIATHIVDGLKELEAMNSVQKKCTCPNKKTKDEMQLGTKCLRCGGAL